jgi:hypothetical protein
VLLDVGGKTDKNNQIIKINKLLVKIYLHADWKAFTSPPPLSPFTPIAPKYNFN